MDLKLGKSPDSMFGFDKPQPVDVSEEAVSTQAAFSAMLTPEGDPISNFESEVTKIGSGDFSSIDDKRYRYSEAEMKEMAKIYTGELIKHTGSPSKQSEISALFSQNFYESDGRPKLRDIRGIAFLESFKEGQKTGSAESRDAQANIVGRMTVEKVLQETEIKDKAVNFNKMLMGEGKTNLDLVLDFLGGFVPLAEGVGSSKAYATILETLTGEKQGLMTRIIGSVFPGTTKEKLTELVKSYPVDQQADVIHKISEILRAKGTGIFPGTDNHLRSIGILQAAGSSSSRSTANTVDDVFGVLDATGLLSGARVLGGAFRGAVGKANAAKVSAADVFSKNKGSISAEELGLPANLTNPITPEVGQGAPVQSNLATNLLGIEPTKVDGLKVKLSGLLEDLKQLKDKSVPVENRKIGIKALNDEIKGVKEEIELINKTPPKVPEDTSVEDSLFNSFSAGKTEVTGQKNYILQAARYVKEKGGLKDRAAFSAFKDKLQTATFGLEGAERNEAIKRVMAGEFSKTKGASLLKLDVNFAKDFEITPHNKLFVTKDPTPLSPEEKLFKRTFINSTITSTHQNTPFAITKYSNPEKAEAMKNMMVESKDPTLVVSLTGQANVNEALVDMVRPQILDDTGRVQVGVADDAGRIVPDVIGNRNYTEGEKASALSKVSAGFKSAKDTTFYQNMSGFRVHGDRIEVSALYGGSGGSFPSPAAAKAQVQLSLRDYGVADAEMTLMRQEGTEFVPVKWEAVGDLEQGNYLVRVETSRRISTDDVEVWDLTKTKMNFFDRLPLSQSAKRSSYTRYIMDTAAMIDPLLHRAMSAAIDGAAEVEARLNILADSFAEPLKKMAKARREKVEDYFREANRKGIAFNEGDLISRGFTKKERTVIQQWRAFWDLTYEVENQVLINTLRGDGFKVFSNGQDRIFLKEVSAPKTGVSVYDPSIGGYRYVGRDEITSLYESGGKLGKPRSVMINGEEKVEYVLLSKESVERTRGISDLDSVLAYRQGYYTVRYKAPKVVEEVVRSSSGKELYTRAVAMAGDTKTAEAYAGKRNYEAGSVKYRVRDSVERMRLGDEDWWEINDVNGRLSQRHRGQQLDNAEATVELDGTSYMMSPAESAITASRTAAAAVAMRPTIEAAKARFMSQYGQYVREGVSFPRTEGDINVSSLGRSAGEIADMRTNMEFILYMESGYINSLDAAWKQLFNSIGEQFGEAGFSRIERSLINTAEFRPTASSKTFAFLTYIASHPLRQWIVQPIQSIRMLGYNPQGAAFATKYAAESASGVMSKDTINLNRILQETGLLSSIQKSNLVRDSLLDLTDKKQNLLTKGLDVSRKVGFDVGESVNIRTHSAFVYDKMKREGFDMDSLEAASTLQERVRNLTYNMNKAGDFPYTQGSAAAIMQFLQIPHKALMQLFNRQLTLREKVVLGGFDIAMWGLPVSILTSFGLDVVTGDETVDEGLRDGLASLMMNSVLSNMGQDTLDLSGLNAYSLDGWHKVIVEGFMESGLSGAFLASPIGAFFKEGGRLTSAVRNTVMLFNYDDEGVDTADKAVAIAKEYAKIFSGPRNAFNAYDMYTLKKSLTSKGVLIDDNPTLSAVFGQLVGFQTKDVAEMYKTTTTGYQLTKAYKDDINKTVDSVLNFYHMMTGSPISDPEAILKAGGLAMSRYKGDAEAQKLVGERIKQFARTNPEKMSEILIKVAKIPTVSEETFNLLLSSSNISDDKKAALKDLNNTRRHLVESYKDKE
jgi:hypothetical protein